MNSSLGPFLMPLIAELGEPFPALYFLFFGLFLILWFPFISRG